MSKCFRIKQIRPGPGEDRESCLLANHWFYSAWPESWKSFHITFLELFRIVIALHIWGPVWPPVVLLCGISLTHSQRQRYFLCIYLFIYLFICPLIEVLVTWFLVWVFRREKTGCRYTVSRLCFVGGHSFQLLLADFEDFSRCAFSLQGKQKSLSFLTFSLSIFKS